MSDAAAQTSNSQRRAAVKRAGPRQREPRAGHAHRGELTLAGRTRPLALAVEVRDGVSVVEALLHQPDFGITPYSAMLGTLRIQPEVRVRVTAPFVARAPESGTDG